MELFAAPPEAKHMKCNSKNSLTNILIACVLIFPILSGCSKDSDVIWESTIQSKDGRYIAHAETIQQGGPGNATVETEVTLTQSGQKDGTRILILSHDDAPQPVKDTVQIKWIEARKLQLTYITSSHVEFQAVRAAGVDIESAPSS